MRNLYYDDFEDFACAVADSYDTLDYEDEEDIVVIAKYEEARQIIRELLCLGYDIHSLEIHDDLWENYEAEYVVSLYDNSVWCEPMLRENGYIDEDAPVIYVLDNCSSKVIPHCKGKNVFEVSIGVDECDCNECECACQKEDKPTTTSKESYFVNGRSVTKEQFDKKFEQLEEKYLDNIRDMLLNHLEFQQEMDEWRRLFRW